MTLAGSLNTSQALAVNNALNDFYYSSFYRPLLATSFFIGVLISAVLVAIAWSWTQIRYSESYRLRPIISFITTISLLGTILSLSAFDLRAQFGLIDNGGLFQPPGSASDPSVVDSPDFARFIRYRELFMNIPVHTLQTILLGVSTTLTLMMIWVVHRQRQSGLGLMGTTIPALCVVMYLSALGYWVTGTVFTAEQISSAAATGRLLSATENTPEAISLRVKLGLSFAFFSLNLVLSDVVVFWRAWVVWNKRRTLLFVAAIFVFTTIVLCIVNLVVEQAIFVNPDWARALDTTQGDLVLSFGTNVFGLAALFTSLVSNIVATSLIGLKAWQHRRFVTSQLVCHQRLTVVERVMLLLVQSGALYICLWIFYATTVLKPNLYFNDDYILAFSSSWAPPAEAFIQTSVPQLSAIYPMIILILVALDKTRGDHPLSYGVPVARDPSLQPVTVDLDLAIDRSEHDTSICQMESRETRECTHDAFATEKVWKQILDPAIVA